MKKQTRVFLLCAALVTAYSCSSDDPLPNEDPVVPENPADPEPEPEPEPFSGTPAEVLAYKGPEYADDYRFMADWSQRAKWNLANVHDPTVMLADDGYYYMYQTDASFGNAHMAGGHFHCRRSRDLVNWEYLGGTMSTPPAWVKERLNTYRTACGLEPIENPSFGFWAPTARNCGNGLYRMYYAIVVTDPINGSSNWTERAFIGLMETRDPASNVWEDKGFVVCSASDRGLDWNGPLWEGAYFRFNAIDPSYIITPEGQHWLVYGSWHSGFAILRLNAETGLAANALPDPWGTAEDIAPYGTLVATRAKTSRWQASEAPEVVYRNGYYYMFMAYDALDVPYNTRVARATKVDGPYTDMYGTDISQNGGEAFPILTHPYKFDNSPGWVGISHCAVFNDNEDNWYYASQARFPADYDSWAPNAIMLGHVRSIRWTDDNWPLVMPERYGAVPQVAINEGEIAGVWENIDLAYQYATQRTSTRVTFAEDHTISDGLWKGTTWRFDAEGQKIILGNGLTLYLSRECDWETEGRPATITYAAIGDHRTYIGKHCK